MFLPPGRREMMYITSGCPALGDDAFPFLGKLQASTEFSLNIGKNGDFSQHDDLNTYF